MRKNKAQIIVTITIFSIFISLIALNIHKEKECTSVINNDVISIIIDAGHGGEDPGSVVNGTKEADINLKIALLLKDILTNKGFNVVMTRYDECGLVISDNVKWNKVTDMNIRKNLINAVNAQIMVSIHQNYYSDTSIRGAQVFYSACMSENEYLAECIQEELKLISKVPNNREVARDDELIVLKNNDKPSVLVECGFLSNDDERAILQTKSYQKEVANAIYNGIWQFLTSQKTNSDN